MAEVGIRYIANQYQHPRNDVWINYDIRKITECEDPVQREKLIRDLALQMTVDLLKQLLTGKLPP